MIVTGMDMDRAGTMRWLTATAAVNANEGDSSGQ
jgi:hypothetical protein